jgi:hypothetical protein
VLLDRLVQRNLVQVALSLQQAKGDAFRTLRRYAVCQARASRSNALTMLNFMSGPAHPREMSAYWLGRLLAQAQMRLAGSAWSRLMQHADLSRCSELYRLSTEGHHGLRARQHEAWARLVRERFRNSDDAGVGPLFAFGPTDMHTEWVC